MTKRSMSAERANFLAGVFCTAIEGGIGDWAGIRWIKYGCDQDVFTPALASSDTPFATTSAQIWDAEKDEELATGVLIHTITLDSIELGIERIKAKEFELDPDVLKCILVGDRNDDASNIDAGGADAIIQAALFGELVYC